MLDDCSNTITSAIGPALGLHNMPYDTHNGITSAPQHWPDAPNHPYFPFITMRPGEIFPQTSRLNSIVKDKS